jgi:hypothetical protein
MFFATEALVGVVARRLQSRKVLKRKHVEVEGATLTCNTTFT